MKANILLVVAYIYILCLSFVSIHYSKDESLMLLLLTAMAIHAICSIYLRKYQFILALAAVIIVPTMFNMQLLPYSFNIMLSGAVEKEISYKDGKIFIVRFNDKSSVTVLYDGKNKTCIGREYEGKYRCRVVSSLVDKYIATHNQDGTSNLQQSEVDQNHNNEAPIQSIFVFILFCLISSQLWGIRKEPMSLERYFLIAMGYVFLYLIAWISIRFFS